jgi:hypothetical protein
MCKSIPLAEATLLLQCAHWKFPWSDHFVFCAKFFCGCKEMISGVFKPNPKPFPVGKA